MLRAARVTLALLLGLAACGLTATQREAARRFSGAAVTLGDFAGAELSRMRDTTVALNTTSVAIRGGADPTDLHGAFTPDAVAARAAAADALASYGRLLLALIEDTQQAELDAAADDFVTSLHRVSGRSLSDEQLAALGKLVSAAGRQVVEYKKARAVKRIVPQAFDDVNRVSDLLIADLQPTAMNLGQQVTVVIKRVRADADVALADGKATPTERAVAMEGLRIADQAEARLSVVDRDAVRALAALKAANAELKAAMADDQVTLADVRALAVQVKDLSDAARALGGK